MNGPPQQSRTFDKIRGLFGVKPNDSLPSSPLGEKNGDANNKMLTVNSSALRLLKGIRPGQDLERRLKYLGKICNELLPKKLAEGVPEDMLRSIDDLLSHDDPNVRKTALHLLQELSRYHQENLGLSRHAIFRYIGEYKFYENELPERLAILETLSKDGLDIRAYTDQLAGLLLAWLEIVCQPPAPRQDLPAVEAGPKSVTDAATGASSVDPEEEQDLLSCRFLPFLGKCIKLNAVFFDTGTIHSITAQVCILACRSGNITEIHCCLDVLREILCYSRLSSEGDIVLFVITTLCRLSNNKKIVDTVWHLMQTLLSTHLGYTAVMTMCKFLEAAGSYPHPNVIRGCVFFLGMSLWGPKKVDRLDHTPTSILPSMRKALATQDAEVVYEVTLHVKRLAQKYHDRLQLMAWDLIVSILEDIGLFIDSDHAKTVGIHRDLFVCYHDTLTVLERLHEGDSYFGSADRLFRLIESCSKDRPEKSILCLLEYKHKAIGPTKEQWLGSLQKLTDTFFTKEARSSVRIKAINILKRIYTENIHHYGDQIVERVVQPCCEGLVGERDYEVLEAFINLLIDIAKKSKNTQFVEIKNVFDQLINSRISGIKCASTKEAGGRPLSEDINDYLALVEKLVCGLIDIVHHYWSTSRAIHSLETHETLVSHVHKQYESGLGMSPGLSGGKGREMIMKYLLGLRCDQQGRVGCSVATGEVVFTSFLTYDSSDEVSPPNSPGFHLSSLRPTLFSYTASLEAITACIMRENCWPIWKATVVGLPQLLTYNRSLVAHDNNELTRLTNALISVINDSSKANLFYDMSGSHATCADVAELVYPCLASLVSFKDLLDNQTRTRLATTIQAGLVSEKSTKAVLSIICCVVEMGEAMAPMIRDLMRRLADIPATPNIAIPILELIGTVVRQSYLYGDKFTEKDYRHVFEVLTAYLSPFKFTNFIVAQAYHLTFLWFLRCPLVLRRNVAASLMELLDKLQDSCPTESSKGKSPDPAVALQAEAMLVLHEFISLYTFSNSPFKVSDGNLKSFMLQNVVMKRNWLWGNRIISIHMTDYQSGQGLCQGCMAAYLPPGFLSPRSPISSSPAEVGGDGAPLSPFPMHTRKTSESSLSDRRQRHKSEGFRNFGQKANVRVTAYDDTSLDRGSNHMERAGSISFQPPLTPNLSVVRFDIPETPSPRSADGRRPTSAALPPEWPPACSCWARGWAMVVVRYSWGKSEWMFQLSEEESSLFAKTFQFKRASMQDGQNSSVAWGTKDGSLLMLSGRESRAVSSVDTQPYQPAGIIRRAHPSGVSTVSAATSSSLSVSNPAVNEQGASTVGPQAPLRLDVSPDEKAAHRLSQQMSASSLTTSYYSTRSESTKSVSNSMLMSPPYDTAPPVNPSSVFFQLFQDTNLKRLLSDAASGEKPLLLPDTDQVERCFKNFDTVLCPRIGRSVGVVYVGPGQKTEQEILSNQYGSVRYEKFLKGLGEYVHLPDMDPRITNLGGLDTSGCDGKFAIMYNDPVTQIVFHTATLMPAVEGSKYHNIKRHIGNDFVSIVYNDSSQPYKRDTIHGQFCYAAIVVQPVDDNMLALSLQAKDEISRWLALKDAVVRDEAAPILCRQMALRAELSSKVWWDSHNKEPPFLSRSVERLREIRRLKEKFGASNTFGMGSGAGSQKENIFSAFI